MTSWIGWHPRALAAASVHARQNLALETSELPPPPLHLDTPLDSQLALYVTTGPAQGRDYWQSINVLAAAAGRPRAIPNRRHARSFFHDTIQHLCAISAFFLFALSNHSTAFQSLLSRSSCLFLFALFAFYWIHFSYVFLRLPTSVDWSIIHGIAIWQDGQERIIMSFEWDLLFHHWFDGDAPTYVRHNRLAASLLYLFGSCSPPSFCCFWLARFSRERVRRSFACQSCCFTCPPSIHHQNGRDIRQRRDDEDKWDVAADP